MALHDSDPLLELTLYFLNLLGNFFAIFTGTYDSNAFWEERYLSGNTENYYWHIFCWSFDECDRARVFCWFLLFILIVTLLGLWFTVDSCLSNRKHAAERLTLESELETCRKGRIEDGIKIADLDNSNKLLRDRNGGLEKDLADSRKQAAETAEGVAQLILNANGRAEGFERQLDDARTTNEQLEEKVEALEDLAKSSRDCVGRLEKKVEDLEKKVEDQHKDAEALEDQVGKLLREKADATRQFSRIQTKFVNEESAKTDEMRKARNSKAAEDKATQEASTLKKDLRALQRQLPEFEQKQNDVEKTETQYEQRAARHDEESTRKDAKITSQTEELRQKTTDLETLRNDLEKAKGQTQSHQIKLENVTKEKTELQKRSEEAATHAARQIKQLQQQNSEHETLQDEIREIKSENESLRDDLEQANTAVEQTSKLQQDRHKTEHKTLRRTANTPDQHHDNAAERTATNEAGIYTLLSNETTTDSQAELANVQTRATQAEKAANDAANRTRAASERYEDEQNQRAIAERRIAELETPRDRTEQQVAEYEGYYPQISAEAEETFQTAVDMYEEVNTAAKQKTAAKLARYEQEIEPAVYEEHVEVTARQDPPAGPANILICSRYLGGGCPYKRCRKLHPAICVRKHCQEEKRDCTKYHRKTKMCKTWSATGRCEQYKEGGCKPFMHPTVC